MTKIFVTGIGTDVGKTVVSAIVTEALQADYFKPVQAGDLHFTDTDKVRQLISNDKTVFHRSAYSLKTPASPHAAAALEQLVIEREKIGLPKTDNRLVIEGAGGLLVPLNDTQTILDLIEPEYKVIVVSRHYLGSINHTLLTLNLLQQKGFDISLIFNGNETKSTEEIILKMTNAPVIGRVDEEEEINENTVLNYARLFKDKLERWINQ
ncbi:MAG: dethiobiotin synthase [Chitinophagales bacterium]|nr:dethiobiotin synthase [Chitinophagales bacterium]